MIRPRGPRRPGMSPEEKSKAFGGLDDVSLDDIFGDDCGDCEYLLIKEDVVEYIGGKIVFEVSYVCGLAKMRPDLFTARTKGAIETLTSEIHAKETYEDAPEKPEWCPLARQTKRQ